MSPRLYKFFRAKPKLVFSFDLQIFKKNENMLCFGLFSVSPTIKFSSKENFKKCFELA